MTLNEILRKENLTFEDRAAIVQALRQSQLKLDAAATRDDQAQFIAGRLPTLDDITPGMPDDVRRAVKARLAVLLRQHGGE